MNTSNNHWTIDYALALVHNAANPSYGIEDHGAIKRLIAQKNTGDPNALYAYAYLLRGYNGANEEFNLSLEQTESTFFNIFWELSEQDHPQACDEMVKCDNSYIFECKYITKEDLFAKKQQCAKVALEHNLSNHMYYADTFLFGLNDEYASDLILKDSPYLDDDHKELVAQAIPLYEKQAQTMGLEYCFGRMVEAYYHGIGVEQNTTTAAAWAKLIKERVTYQSAYKNVNWVKAIYPVFEYPSIQKNEEFKTLYAQLQKLPQW